MVPALGGDMMNGTVQAVAPAGAVSPVVIPRRSFEALLYLVRPPPPALLDALSAAGYDLALPQECYSLEVFLAVQDVFRRHLFPDLPAAQGQRLLGRRFIQGFGSTVVGRVLAGATSVLGPERVLARLPGYLRCGVDGLHLTTEAVRERVWRVSVTGRTARPEFICGLVEGILATLHVRGPRATLVAHEGDRFEALVSWSAPRA